ncbi:hypothetical protein M2302_005954 [Micromonospora sp. A200]|nr:hypothetical protein [Micromonospora sp. A200]
MTESGSHSNGATNVMPLVVADVAGSGLLPICSQFEGQTAKSPLPGIPATGF